MTCLAAVGASEVTTRRHVSIENPTLLRATVLVFWPRQLVTSAPTPGGDCTTYFDVAQDENTANAAGNSTWHMVYAVTAIRKNPL